MNRRTNTVQKETDYKPFRRMVAYAGLVSPDLKSPEFVEKFKPTRGREWDMLDKVFLAGEVDYIAQEILRISGYSDDFVETVKNS